MFKNFFNTPTTSSNLAKNRLKLVLAKERVGISEINYGQLKEELFEVISKYFKIEHDSLELDIVLKKDHSALNLNTPLNRQLLNK